MIKTVYLRTLKKSFFLFGLFLLLQGCGYSNPYMINGSADGKEANKASLYVVMWENRTGELGYQAEIHKKLIYWLNKSPNWHIVYDREQADYILSGIIQSADFPGLSYDRFENVRGLRAEINFDYDVRAQKTDEIILQRHDLTKRKTFSVSGSAATTEREKKAALNQIADDMADEIYTRLFHKLAQRQ